MSSRGLSRWVAPHFGTVFFVLHVVVALMRPGDLLHDPGTGWHLATGRLILETGAVPRHDVFSFTAAGRPWVDYYWLFQTVAAWLVGLGGLPLYAVVCVLIYAAVPALLYRRMVRTGANPLAALIVVPLAYLVLLSHAMARPHVLTYLFVLVLLDWIDDVRAGRRGIRSAWWPPCLTAVWCNLHGGFVAGVALVAVAAVATAAQALVDRDDLLARRAARLLGAVTVAMALATLINPYGIDLVLSVGRNLGMESTTYFPDFQSPSFQGGGASVRAFEVMILGLLAIAALGRLRLPLPDVALTLLTLHWALGAQRNMNLFVLVGGPIMARAITPILESLWPSGALRWQAIGAQQTGLRSPVPQIAVVSAVVVALAVRGSLPISSTLEGQQLTTGAARFIDAHLDRFARPFHTDALGGTLIYQYWPAVHVFVDDRNVVYGDDFMMNDYFTVLLGQPRWQAILDKWGIDMAIVQTSAPCATLFATSPAWVQRYGDDEIVILERRASGQLAPSHS